MARVLGISAFYHDSAAVLLDGGHVVAALQEERFSRVKHDRGFPARAIAQCLEIGGAGMDDVDLVCFYEDSRKKFGRIVATYLDTAPAGLSTFSEELASWVRACGNGGPRLREEIHRHLGVAVDRERVRITEHHLSHAASAFYPSPFDRAAVLCIDGVGEWATTSAWTGDGERLTPLWQIDFPNSLGLLYSAFTQFCGFKVDSGEYKLMGLAPYGEPRFRDRILDEIVDVKADGSFALNMRYFDYRTGRSMTGERFTELFDGPRREPEAVLTQREMDLAASIQSVTEDIVLRLATTVRRETEERHLCLAGGVALNCVANGRVQRAGIFDDLWIQPASGDAGGALGAAYWGHIQLLSGARPDRAERRRWNTCMGNCYEDAEIRRALDEHGAVYERVDDRTMLARAADALAEGEVVGWFQGRMEYGPRALGSRSILGDPRRPDMQQVMNLKIKNRESFRPFAPAVLEEYASEWFDTDRPSPHMLLVAPVAASRRLSGGSCDGRPAAGLDKLKTPRSVIPAVTHVDCSARLQTVGAADGNPLFHRLLERFHEMTACPVLINTSFNVRGEPIVESPRDAYTCFMRTAMDCLCIGHFLLRKRDQPPFADSEDWTRRYELD
jgi:carbamoyltransferase